MKENIVRTVILFMGLMVLAVGSVQAMDIMGTITTTRTITNQSQLVGNVNCTVGGAPCIKFGASNIKLRLNGFTINGQADPNFGCGGGGPVLGEDGISTGGRSHVEVVGPGLVRRFRNHGVNVTAGSTKVKVKKVTVSTNCHNGIQVSGSDNEVEENVAVRNSSIATLPCGGIEVEGNNNRVRRNETSGNGLVFPGFPVPVGSPFVDFGIGIFGKHNQIEENGAGGNVPNGITIFPAAAGNTLRRNQAVGNPPVSDSLGIPFATTGRDIRNLSPAGANTFKQNLCETSINAPCPNLPHFAGHKPPEPGS